MFKRSAAWLLGLVIAVQSGSVMSGGGGGGWSGATEWTQLANNAELIATTANTASAVSEAVQQTILQAQQYMTMVQNLKQLDPSQLMAILGPYQTQVADLTRLYGAVNGIVSSGQQLSGMLTTNMQQMAAMNLNPQQFLQWLQVQGRQRGSQYGQQLNQELQVMRDFEKRYQALQEAQRRIPGIDGQVAGLQSLNQMTGLAVAELMDLRQVIQRQQIAKVDDRQNEEVARDLRRQLLLDDFEAGDAARRTFREAFERLR